MSLDDFVGDSSLSEVYEDDDEDLGMDYEDEPDDLRFSIVAGYDTCRKAGLSKLARIFGLTAEQFAKNLNHNKQHYQVSREMIRLP